MKIKLIDHGYKALGKLPNRAHYNDSGADVFAIEDTIVPAHGVVAINTGVGVELPDGYDICVHCKSGLSKNGIWVSNSPVDAGYTGAIHAIVVNMTDKPFEFKRGDKVGQFVVRPVIYAEFVEDLGDERGANGFGSTGNK